MKITFDFQHLLKKAKKSLRARSKRKRFKPLVISREYVLNYYANLEIYKVYDMHDYVSSSSALYRYEYDSKVYWLVGTSKHGTCSYCDDDMRLEDEIVDSKPEKIIKLLLEDMEEKLLSYKVFTKRKLALEHITKESALKKLTISNKIFKVHSDKIA